MCLRVFVKQDTRDGRGTGKLHGRQRFVCKTGFAVFVRIEAVIPEEDFDENPVNARSTRTSEKVENVEEEIRKDKPLAKSLSFGACSSGKLPLNFIYKKNSFDPLGYAQDPCCHYGCIYLNNEYVRTRNTCIHEKTSVHC